MGIFDFVYLQPGLPIKCYIWGVGLYGGEICTLGKIDQKYLGSFCNVVLVSYGEKIS